MAESSWPGPAPAVVTEYQHELLWTTYYQSGLVGNPGQQPLIYADSTGMHIKVRPNRRAIVRGQMWSTDDDGASLSISENASGATRLDRVVLRLDRSTWQVRLSVVEGVPGSGEPAIKQDLGPDGQWDLWVGTVTVPTGAVTIRPSDVRPRDLTLGPQLLIASQDDLPNENVPPVFLRWLPTPGELRLQTQGSLASGYKTLWSDSGEIRLDPQANSNWEPAQTSVIRKTGPYVHLRLGSLQRVSSSRLSPSSESFLPGRIPVEMRHPTRDLTLIARTSGHYAARIRIYHANSSDAGRIKLVNHPGIDPGDWVMPESIMWPVP